MVLKKIISLSLMVSFLTIQPSATPQSSWISSHLPQLGCAALGIAAHYGIKQFLKEECKNYRSAQFAEKVAAQQLALPQKNAPHLSASLAKQVEEMLEKYKKKNERIELLKNQRNALKTSAAIPLILSGAVALGVLINTDSNNQGLAANFKKNIGLLSAPLCGLGTWFLASAANFLYKSSQIQKESAELDADFKQDREALVSQEKNDKELYAKKCAQEAKGREEKEDRERVQALMRRSNQIKFEEAILANDLATAKECERAGADVNGGYYNNFSLDWAMGPKHNTVFHYLTHNPSFDVNKPLPNGDTPLIHACRTGNVAAVQKLLALDSVNVNAKDNQGSTALIVATENGHSECVHHILRMRKDVNVNAQNALDRTALWIAAQKENLALVQELLASGANPNQDGVVSLTQTIPGIKIVRMNSLGIAFQSGFLGSIFEILNAKATQLDDQKIAQLRQINNTQLRQHPALNKPLLDALKSKNIQELNKALKEGCDVNARDFCNSENPLQHKAFTGPSDVLPGTPALHLAIATGDLAIVNRMLQEPNIEVAAPTHLGITALMVAAQAGNEAIVSALLAKPPYFTTPQQRMNIPPNQLAINLGAGTTKDAPLHFAAHAGNLNCIKKLMEMGANPMLINKAGFTPAQVAQLQGNHAAAQLLAGERDLKSQNEYLEDEEPYEIVLKENKQIRLTILPKKDMQRLLALGIPEYDIYKIRTLPRFLRAMVSAIIHENHTLADALIKSQKSASIKDLLIVLKRLISRLIREAAQRKEIERQELRQRQKEQLYGNPDLRLKNP